jgi:hypothetical protein
MFETLLFFTALNINTEIWKHFDLVLKLVMSAQPQ